MGWCRGKLSVLKPSKDRRGWGAGGSLCAALPSGWGRVGASAVEGAALVITHWPRQHAVSLSPPLALCSPWPARLQVQGPLLGRLEPTLGREGRAGHGGCRGRCLEDGRTTVLRELEDMCLVSGLGGGVHISQRPDPLPPEDCPPYPHLPGKFLRYPESKWVCRGSLTPPGPGRTFGPLVAHGL